jgi:hypothetical protein
MLAVRVNSQVLEFCLFSHTLGRCEAKYLPYRIFGNQQHPAGFFSQPHVVAFPPLRCLRVFPLDGDDGGDILRCGRADYHSTMVRHFISASVWRM